MNYCWFRPDCRLQTDQPVRRKAVPLRPVLRGQGWHRTQSQSSEGESDMTGSRLTHTAMTKADSNGDIVCGSPTLPLSSSSSMASLPGSLMDGGYDFYLAVPEEDLQSFGIPFSRMVEERMGMRPCLTIRDIPAGAPKFEAMAETLETKCNGKVIFVVSRSFHSSEECQFLVHFAKTLDPCALRQKLIPMIIDKDVKLPRELQGLSAIHYNQAMREGWLFSKLWQPVHCDSCVPPSEQYGPLSNSPFRFL